MRFNVKDKSANKLITVHQAFVRFYNAAKDKSVIFVAEHDNSLQYKFDLVSLKFFRSYLLNIALNSILNFIS